MIGVLESRGEASAAEIAKRTGEPLSSVYRLLQSLDRGRLGRSGLAAGQLPAGPAAADHRRPARGQAGRPRVRLAVSASPARGHRHDELPVRATRHARGLRRTSRGAGRALARHAARQLTAVVRGRGASRHLGFPSAGGAAVVAEAVPTPRRSASSGRDRYSGRHRTCPTRWLRCLRRRCHSWDRGVGGAGVQPPWRARGGHLDQRAQVADPGLLTRGQHRVDHLVCARGQSISWAAGATA